LPFATRDLGLLGRLRVFAGEISTVPADFALYFASIVLIWSLDRACPKPGKRHPWLQSFKQGAERQSEQAARPA